MHQTLADLGFTRVDAGGFDLYQHLPGPRLRHGHLHHWRSSNFNRNVLKRAYRAAGWRDPGGTDSWTWHSQRQVFCTTALFTWNLDATDVFRMAGHANSRSTLDMYIDITVGVLDGARTATQ